MKLEQSFEVSAPVEQVWRALIDIERVAPCLPGASITGRNEDGSYNGAFTIKIGPTTASYTGKLEMKDVDEGAHTATMLANGSDRRGQGGANATINSKLTETGGGTRVEVDTDYHITGRLARFGRGGMIEDISERLLREFASRLQASLAQEPAAPAPEPATAIHEAAPEPEPATAVHEAAAEPVPEPEPPAARAGARAAGARARAGCRGAGACARAGRSRAGGRARGSRAGARARTVRAGACTVRAGARTARAGAGARARRARARARTHARGSCAAATTTTTAASASATSASAAGTGRAARRRRTGRLRAVEPHEEEPGPGRRWGRGRVGVPAAPPPAAPARLNGGRLLNIGRGSRRGARSAHVTIVLCMRQPHSASALVAAGRGVPAAAVPICRGQQSDAGRGRARRRRGSSCRGGQMGWGPKDQVGAPTRIRGLGVRIHQWPQRLS